MPQLVLGTNNAKKRIELEEILAPHGLTVRILKDFPLGPDVVEDGETFVANAEKKAREQALRLGEWVLADDSGLCVPSLGGAPGVYSARYSGEGATDASNNAKLLAELANKDGDDRRAYYVCVVALANPQGEIIATREGRCHGMIRRTPAGSGGFGYDPLFEFPELGQTFGELSAEHKHQLSHRGIALREILPVILEKVTGH